MKYTLTVGEIDKMKIKQNENKNSIKLESHWHAKFSRLFANFVADFRTTFVRVLQKYLKKFSCVANWSRSLSF